MVFLLRGNESFEFLNWSISKGFYESRLFEKSDDDEILLILTKW